MADATPLLPEADNPAAGANPPGINPAAEARAVAGPEPWPAALAPAGAAPVSPPPLPPARQYEVVRSADGRVVLTNDRLEIDGRTYGWRELESVDVQRVRWLLWLLLGGFTLAGFLLGFLQNWLRTLPAALGMMVGALLLALGQRGTNRLRLFRLGREAAHFALPGELAPWQKLTAEMNRRIQQRHHEAAEAATAALLAIDTTPAEPAGTDE